MESLRRCIGEGSWPLWNPEFGFGAPMLADASYQLGYPFTWLQLALAPAVFYKALAFVHAALAALGCFELARRYGQCDGPAFLAAGLWACSGPFLSTLAMNHHFAGAALMPWALLALERALDAPSARASLWLAAAGALQLLAGSGDICAMTGVAAGLRVVVRLAAKRPGAELRPGLVSAGAGVVLALGLASLQWIPTLALVSESGRGRMAAPDREYWSLAPPALVDLVVPRLVGDAPLGEAARARLFEGREPFLACLYVGVVGFPLAALGASSRRPAARFLVLACATFLVLALGRFSPLYDALVRVPPFGLLRYPVKYVVPFALFFGLLAGLGLCEWRNEPLSRRRLRFAAALGAGLAAAALVAGRLLAAGGPAVRALLDAWLLPEPATRAEFQARAAADLYTTAALGGLATSLIALRTLRPAWSGRTALALAVVALADAARVGQAVNPTAPAALVAHVPPVVARLGGTGSPARVFSPASERPWLIAQLTRGPAGWDAESRWTLGLLELLQPPRAARFGLSGSFDGDFTGLAPGPTGEVAGLVHRFRGTRFGVRLLRIGSVDFVVTLERQTFADLAEAGPPLGSVFREPIHVLRVPDPLPRARFATRWRVASEPASYVQLADPRFDPEQEVVLAAPPPIQASAGVAVAAAVRPIERRMDRLAFETEAAAPGLLVLAEAYDRGWRARVDGAPAPLFRANALFRAVPVAAGRHRVELAYRPAAVAWGAGVSAGSLVAAIALACAGRR